VAHANGAGTQQENSVALIRGCVVQRRPSRLREPLYLLPVLKCQFTGAFPASRWGTMLFAYSSSIRSIGSVNVDEINKEARSGKIGPFAQATFTSCTYTFH
jgi:hypothetical protein